VVIPRISLRKVAEGHFYLPSHGSGPSLCSVGSRFQFPVPVALNPKSASPPFDFGSRVRHFTQIADPYFVGLFKPLPLHGLESRFSTLGTRPLTSLLILSVQVLHGPRIAHRIAISTLFSLIASALCKIPLFNSSVDVKCSPYVDRNLLENLPLESDRFLRYCLVLDPALPVLCVVICIPVGKAILGVVVSANCLCWTSCQPRLAAGDPITTSHSTFGHPFQFAPPLLEFNCIRLVRATFKSFMLRFSLWRDSLFFCF